VLPVVFGRVVHVTNRWAVAQRLLDLVDRYTPAVAAIWARRAGFGVDLAAPLADEHSLAHAGTATKHCTATPRTPAK